MLTLSIIIVASLAVLAACAWRAPVVDEQGRIVGSISRDQAKGEQNVAQGRN